MLQESPALPRGWKQTNGKTSICWRKSQAEAVSQGVEWWVSLLHCTNVQVAEMPPESSVFKENTEVAGNLALLLRPTEGDGHSGHCSAYAPGCLTQARTS